MLSVYIGCLIFGGVLFLASTFLGDHAHGGHLDTDHDLGKDGGHALGGLPFASLRFWTFALGGFGLTGVALSLAGAGAVLTPLLAGAMGVGSGYGTWRVLGALTNKPVGQLGAADGHLGREGTLLLPVARGRRGKMRLSVGGATHDFLVETESEEPLPRDARVLVVGVRGHALLVERTPALPPVQSDETLSEDPK